jgi:hypothetical protein
MLWHDLCNSPGRVPITTSSGVDLHSLPVQLMPVRMIRLDGDATKTPSLSITVCCPVHRS